MHCSFPLAKTACIHDDGSGKSNCPASSRVYEHCPHSVGYVKPPRYWPDRGPPMTYDHVPALQRETNVPFHLHDIISKRWNFDELKRKPHCRDCADFGPICPNTGLPCAT